MKRPCLTCGRPSEGSYCLPHTPPKLRKPGASAYDRQAWRKASRQARELQPWCARCGSTSNLTADHVVPLARGGDQIPPPEMLAVLCRSCNSRKGAR